MKQLAYISTAVYAMSDDKLIDILTTSRKNNSQRDITGVLLYNRGTFVQALEGEDDQVDTLFAAIERDPRHTNIIKLMEKPLLQRSFPAWWMGFVTYDKDKVKDIPGFLESAGELLNNDDKSSLIVMLKTFITTNKMEVNY